MRLALAFLCLPTLALAQAADHDEIMEQVAEAMFLASLCEEVSVDEEAAFRVIDAAGIDREEARDRMSIEFTELLSTGDEDTEAASCETAAALYGAGGSDWPELVVSN